MTAHPLVFPGQRLALSIRSGNVLTLVGMLAATVGILALAYFATRWIAKRGSTGRRFTGKSGDERFRVLRQVSLGQNERLVLVRLEDRCLLLGVTPGGISLLRELTEEEASAWLPRETARDGSGEDSDGVPTPPSFVEALKKNLSRRK